MKATSYISALLIVLSTAFITSANAQVSVNVNINTIPDWAPYDYVPETRYYYIPEIEVYYDIPSRMYIYFHRNGWVRSARLPHHLRHFNMYNAYKVSLFDIGPNPYIHYNNHRIKYPKHYHKGHHQPTRLAYNNKPHNTPNRPMGFVNAPNRPAPNHNSRPNTPPQSQNNRGNDRPRQENRNSFRPQDNRNQSNPRHNDSRGNNGPRNERGNDSRGPGHDRNNNGNRR